MTCGLHTKFDKAVDAVKDALHAALDTKDFDRSTLSEVWRHYQGLQTIAESVGSLPHEEHDSISFEGISLPDGCYDPDYNISTNLDFDAVAAGPVPVFTTGGSDTISFSTTAGEDVVTFS